MIFIPGLCETFFAGPDAKILIFFCSMIMRHRVTIYNMLTKITELQRFHAGYSSAIDSAERESFSPCSHL